MDKLAKVRAEVEKLNAQLLRGACSSQVAMETRCKEEAYNEVLAILDTMQEEPVSEDLESEIQRYYVDWDEHPEYVQTARHFARWQKEHLMKNAVDGEIGYWNLRWLSVNADLPRTVEEGDKVKVILIKEK